MKFLGRVRVGDYIISVSKMSRYGFVMSWGLGLSLGFRGGGSGSLFDS